MKYDYIYKLYTRSVVKARHTNKEVGMTRSEDEEMANYLRRYPDPQGMKSKIRGAN
jgi:hypothetical protein